MTSTDASPVTVLWTDDDLPFDDVLDDDSFDDSFDDELVIGSVDDEPDRYGDSGRDAADPDEDDFEEDDGDDGDDGDEAQIVASFTHARLMGGFAAAAVSACRDGVPVALRPGETLYSFHGGGLHVDRFEQRIKALQARQEKVDREIQNARFIIKTSDDDEQRASWASTERDLLRERKSLETRIAQVKERSDRQDAAPPVLLTVAAAVHQALTGLAVPDRRVTQAQYQALRLVVPVFRFDQDELGQWAGTALLRVPLAKGGVAEIGPFSWPLGAGGRGRARVVSRTADARRAEDRSTVRTRLRASGALTMQAEQALLNATFDELPYVVLHGVTGMALPDWVGPQWRTPEFVAWVTRVYTQDPFLWADSGRYVTQSPHRQLLAHLCRQQDVVPLAAVKELVPVPERNAFLRLKRAWVARSGVTWPAAVAWVGGLKGKGAMRARGFTGTRCSCGLVAHIVARVPEVPRALLCECRRMPDAALYGMPADLRFPDAYAQALLMPLEACVEEIWTDLSTRRVKPSAAMQVVLEHDELLRAGCSVWDLEQATGLPRAKVRAAVERLYGYAFLSKDDVVAGMYRMAHPDLTASLAVGVPTLPPLRREPR